MRCHLLLAVSTALATTPSVAAEACTPEVIDGLLRAGADPVLVYRSCKLGESQSTPVSAPSPRPMTSLVPTSFAYPKVEAVAQASGSKTDTKIGDKVDDKANDKGSDKTNGKEPGDTKQTDPLSKFSFSTTNGSTLATVHVATAFAPIQLNAPSTKVKRCDTAHVSQLRTRQGRSDMMWGVGVDVSSSIPANSPTKEDYGRHALTKLDGGLVNLYLSLVGHNTSDCTFSPLDSGDSANPRVKAWDHFYFVTTATPNTMLPYIKHALGIRAIKSSLEKTEKPDTANKDSSSYGGLATYYLGLGVDGPLLTMDRSTDVSARDPNAGWFTVEAFGTANLVNARTLDSLFGTAKTDPAPSHFNTIGARATIGLPGRFYISAEYGKALGSYGKAHIGDTSMLLFGYNNQSDPATGKKPTDK